MGWTHIKRGMERLSLVVACYLIFVVVPRFHWKREYPYVKGVEQDLNAIHKMKMINERDGIWYTYYA